MGRRVATWALGVLAFGTIAYVIACIIWKETHG